MEKPARIDWIEGDATGLAMPAHAAALREGGEAFLTQAFRTSGALAADNRVLRITEFAEVEGGSTGRKLLLGVEYEKPSPSLHRNLFVKFSRDFDDERRDRARTQMEREVLFALLSRDPDFPIPVPVCYYTDFHHESGTGVLITERVPFGREGVEPLYPKCLDHRMPEPAAHYRALVKALARLSGTHKAGGLPDTVETYFPFEPGKLTVSLREPYTPGQIRERVAGFAAFAEAYPQVLPASIRSGAFIERLADEAPRFQALESVAKQALQAQTGMIALCHWNAHVDNAWFWRGPDGELACGLMDWGNVSQMNVAMALWGCLSAAEPELWDEHLDELLVLFAREFEASGGPLLDIAELRRQLAIYVGMMGLAWMLDAPSLILQHVPNLAEAKDRLDPLIQDSERARSQLLIMTVFLALWEREDMSAVMAYLEEFQKAGAG